MASVFIVSLLFPSPIPKIITVLKQGISLRAIFIYHNRHADHKSYCLEHKSQETSQSEMMALLLTVVFLKIQCVVKSIWNTIMVTTCARDIQGSIHMITFHSLTYKAMNSTEISGQGFMAAVNTICVYDMDKQCSEVEDMSLAVKMCL